MESKQTLLNWIRFDREDKDSYPKEPNRYMIYRIKCEKYHFETWNGSGWASSCNEELWYADLVKESNKTLNP